MKERKEGKNSLSKLGKKRGKYNMKVSMSEATLGIKKKLSLQGCLAKWVAMEARKQKEL